MATKLTMAWYKCEVKIGETGESDAMGSELTSVGVVKEKSTTLEASEGDSLEAKATGGETVAKVVLEGTYTAKTRVIEPTDELYTKLGLGSTSETEFHVNTHVVSKDFSLQITPENTGAVGIKAPKCAVTVKPGWSEEEGNYVDLEFEILKGAGGYWYSRFKKG